MYPNKAIVRSSGLNGRPSNPLEKRLVLALSTNPTALPFAPNPARPARVAACFPPDLVQQTNRLRRWPTSHHTLSTTGPHQSVLRSVSFRRAWLAMNRLASIAWEAFMP
ncbi:hypothetical protein CPLU01_12184 [Colletotrichum plurivorum]|uniref:Uncharacterized protein n=1 Tax=Colletotrichum plurivorum TaxID=2175906 RepID=A0A8H6JZI3_9PEZI|nr:hypothetical protein CPLU01_12184 [Colletotrichum plurivorum]